MKHFKQIMLLLIVVTVTAMSFCKKTSAAVAPVPAASGAFTYRTDGGATITVDSANAILYNRVGFGRSINVYAYKAGSQVLEFHFAPTKV